MRKRVFGRQLKRDINQRKLLFRSLMRALVLEERIKTTEAKAKSIKGEIEKMVTRAKNKGEEARVILKKSFSKEVVDKIINDIAPRFKERKGGYTRIVRLGTRKKDNAPIVLLEWVELKKTENVKKVSKKRKKKDVKKDEKKETKVEAKKEKKVKKNEKNNKTNKAK